MYASAVQREQKKLIKKSAKRKPREEISDDSDSDSDMSVQVIESPKSIICAKKSAKSKPRSNRDPEVEIARKKKRAEKAETLPEEKTYQQTVKWLANEGSPVQEEKTESSEEETTSESA
jgi:hypothetical protein